MVLTRVIGSIVIIVLSCASVALGEKLCRDALYGKWVGESRNGKPIYLVFDTEYITMIQVGDFFEKWTYSVDWDKNPAHLDIDMRGRGKVRTIIEVTEEGLRFENNFPGANRPLEFTYKSIIFTKGKDADASVFDYDDNRADPKEKLSHLGIEYSEDIFLKHVERGNTEIVKLFIAAGMSPNVKEDSSGMTALILALFRPDLNTEIALDLIKAGADINAKDDRGWTPLISAAWQGDYKVVKTLIERGADVNATTIAGWSALMRAAKAKEEEHPKIVKELIKAGADVNISEFNGMTALMIACSFKRPDIVEGLIEAGADVNAKDKDGRAPMDYAENSYGSSTSKVIISILRKAGAK